MSIPRLSPTTLPKGSAATPALAFVTALGVTGLWLDETGSVPSIMLQVGGTTALQVAAAGMTFLGNTVWHAGNDGAASGLDADLLDGQHASAFALASHTHAAADIVSGIIATARLGTGTADSSTYLRGDGVWATIPGSAGGTVTSVDASGGSTGLSFSGGPITGAGTLTLGGTLAIGYGGTGATDAAGARTNLGLGTAATRNVPASGNASSAECVLGSDTRLVDASALTTGVLPAGRLSGSYGGVTGLGVLTGLTVSGSGEFQGSLWTVAANVVPSHVAVWSLDPASTPRQLGSRTLTTFKADLSITIADVSGLQTALDGKASVSHVHSGADITSGLVGPAYLGSGTRDGTKFLRDDGTWQAVGGGSGGTVTSIDGSGGATGLTLAGGPITTSGTLTLGGTLAIGSGGTGATDAAGARTNLGLGTAAVKNAPASGDAAAGEVVLGNDSRLTDARTPTSHTHAATDITSGTLASTRLAGAYTGITGLGSLTSLTVSGGLTAQGGITSSAGVTTSSAFICVWESDPDAGYVIQKRVTQAQLIANIGGVTGAGVANAFAYWTGAGTLDDSAQLWLDGSGKVTIGILGDPKGVGVYGDVYTTGFFLESGTRVALHSRAINTGGSLTGGGDLSGDRTLQLVNDSASPGASKVYGTNGSGVKGWQSVVLADAPADGKPYVRVNNAWVELVGENVS